MTKETPVRRWRVGELASATGLTVRALHHYEQIGLLKPAGRTSSHHRLYDERDVERLYHVLTLRELGVSLAEIRRTIDGEGGALVEVLREHLARANRELEVTLDAGTWFVVVDSFVDGTPQAGEYLVVIEPR